MEWLNNAMESMGKTIDSFVGQEEQGFNEKMHVEQATRDYSPEEYTVEKGDTLSKIAHNYNIPISSIKRGSDREYLQIGEKLSFDMLGDDGVDMNEAQDRAKETNKGIQANPAYTDGNNYNYTVKPGETLGKIAKKLGVPLETLHRTQDKKYLQIGEQVIVKGHRAEIEDLGGHDDEQPGALESAFDTMVEWVTGSEKAKGALSSDTYQGKFTSAIANSYLPDAFKNKEWTNEDFSNKFLHKLQTVATSYGSKMKVGDEKVISPEQVSRLFGFKEAGYGNGNIQKDTGDKEIDLMRKGLGNFTLVKTKDGFQINDMYDFKKGTDDHIKGDEQSLFRRAHRLGEDRLSDEGENALKISIKLPKQLLSKLIKV